EVADDYIHNDVEDAGSQDGGDANGEGQAGERVVAVHDQRQGPVELPAGEPGDQAEGKTDGEGEGCCREPDQKCHPRPPDETAQHVLPELVGTEDEAGVGGDLGPLETALDRDARVVVQHLFDGDVGAG